MDKPSKSELESVVHLFRSFKATETLDEAESVSSSKDDLKKFFEKVGGELSAKRIIIEKTPAYTWLCSHPSYKKAFSSIFGGVPERRWGSAFATRMAEIAILDMKSYQQDSRAEGLKVFLRRCCLTEADIWHSFFIDCIWGYFYDPENLDWHSTGWKVNDLEKHREIWEQTNALLSKAKAEAYVFPPRLAQELEIYKSELQEKLEQLEVEAYDPIYRKEDSTSSQRYFMYNIWRWFVDRNCKSPNAETMANLIQVVDESPTERSIARSLARWERSSPLIRDSRRLLDIANANEEKFTRELERQFQNITSLILMDVLKIKDA